MSLGDRIVVMDRGRAAQVGTPQEIYFQPKEAFVADFIGTMNRINGVAENGEFSASGGQIKWDVNQMGPLDLLFRPEKAVITDNPPDAFTGTVATSFFLGDRQRIVIDGIGDNQITLEVDNRANLNKKVSNKKVSDLFTVLLFNSRDSFTCKLTAIPLALTNNLPARLALE